MTGGDLALWGVEAGETAGESGRARLAGGGTGLRWSADGRLAEPPSRDPPNFFGTDSEED